MAETDVKRDRGVRVNMSVGGEAHADTIFKGIPLNLWRQWDKDCADSYHDIRWLKLWSDHLIAKGKIQDRDELVAEVLKRVNFEVERAQEAPVEEDDEEVSVLNGTA